MTATSKTFFGKLAVDFLTVFHIEPNATAAAAAVDAEGKKVDTDVNALVANVLPEIEALGEQGLTTVATAASTELESQAAAGHTGSQLITATASVIKSSAKTVGKELTDEAATFLASLFSAHAAVSASTAGTTLTTQAQQGQTVGAVGTTATPVADTTPAATETTSEPETETAPGDFTDATNAGNPPQQ